MTTPSFFKSITLIVTAIAALGGPVTAADFNVAVAANFTEPAREIAKLFEAKSGNRAILSFGSTGTLYTQISQGAPFAAFLAADAERPVKAIDEGLGVPGSAFTYAVGRLVLWSKDPALVNEGATLQAGKFEKLALANPRTAPYGAAAIEVLEKLGLLNTLRSKLVEGNNIAQTYQFIDTGNAELGFVAASQLARKTDGSRWDVPEALYTPIRQGAVLLKTGAGDEAARAFLDFLRQDAAARKVIIDFGYGVAAGN